MPIAGNPLWREAPRIADMGAGPHKRNAVPDAVLDPDTDVEASQYNTLGATVAHAARTSPFAIVQVDTGELYRVRSARFQHAVGKLQAGYDSRPIYDTGTPGYYRLNFEEPRHVDDFGQEASVSLTSAVVQAQADDPVLVTAYILDLTTVHIRVYDLAGDLYTDPVKLTVTVWASIAGDPFVPPDEEA